MIHLLDSDLNGLDSIQDRVDAGLVNVLPCGSSTEFEAHCRWLIENAAKDDLVVLDTLNTMMGVVISDAKLGTAVDDDLLAKQNKFLNDPNYLSVYNWGTQYIMRRLRNIRARGIRIITTVHEDEETDPVTLLKRRAPNLNKALLESLKGASSDIFRLIETDEDKVNGEGKVVLKAHSRLLQLHKDESVLAKHHVKQEISDKLPKYLAHPTLPKLYKTLDKKPSWLVIYGSPGVGKTSLATSETNE